MEASIFGREVELGAVDETLARARSGFAALVLEGEAGIGKTALWREGVERARGSGYRVLTCRAVEAEARLSFAGLSDLLAPVEPGAFDPLPEPQRRALDAALLRGEPGGAAPDPRAIGTGLATLLGALATTSPVVLAIDDLPWLDRPSARALGFAFRRLGESPVRVLATRRSGASEPAGELLSAPSERIRALRVGPLSLASLYRIVAARLGRKLPRPLLARIERASGGNPFFALEIARALPAEGAGVGALPVPDDLSQLVAARLRKLPQGTRDALLRASALAQPTLTEVDAARLGPAEEAGMVRVVAGDRIEFTHPLFGAGVYASASSDRRRRLHAELAVRASDVEERARHLVLASPQGVQDERVAAVLHEAGRHATSRGALESAAELFEQAAELAPEAEHELRHQRQIRAAQLHLATGDYDRARILSETVLAAASAGPARADALLVHARTTTNARPADAIRELTEALACAGDDAARAAELEVALGATHLLGLQLQATSQHATRAVEAAERAAAPALLAEAIAMRETAHVLRGEPLDEAALERALMLEDLGREAPAFQIRPSLEAAGVYAYLGRFETARSLLLRTRDSIAAAGLESPWVHCLLALGSHASGAFERAEQEASEAERAASLTGREVARVFTLMARATVRAGRGDEEGARADAAETLALSERMAWPYGAIGARYALGHLALSEGDPAAAVGFFELPLRVITGVDVYEWPLAGSAPDAVEALVATGDVARAKRITDLLAEYARRKDRPWALATSARCEALLAAAPGDLPAALAAAERALAEHERLPMPFERARTLLVKGQLERRSGERRAARATLQEALDEFSRIGARLWAERTRGELARTASRRAPAELSESERRVAELAAAGHSNPEIAGRLFMSRRTVEANLSRAFTKLGIRSRAELGLALARAKAPQAP